MRSRWVLVASLAVLLGVCAGCGKKEEPDKGGAPLVSSLQTPRILIAATDALKIEPPFQVANDPNAAGGKYLFVPKKPDGKDKNKPCTATYEFTVATPGAYRLWIRKNWAGGCSNSLFVKLDDQPEFIFGEDGTYERWDWTCAIGKSFDLAAGKHALVIKNREDDSKFDQLLFIADKDYVPQGIEGQ